MAIMICRNCDESEFVMLFRIPDANPDTEGHMSKECPKPRDYSRVKCSNCGNCKFLAQLTREFVLTYLL